MAQRLTAQLTADAIPTAEALLQLAGVTAIELTNAAEAPLLEPAPGETPLWPEVILSALIPTGTDAEGIRQLLEHSLNTGRHIAVSSADDKNWRAALWQPIAPRRFGQQLWLLPDGVEPVPPPRPEDARVYLHMGLAFGTGEHPTTAMCLDWLDGHSIKGAKVLDFGCGSGVLALAALAMGAQSAWATDNEPQALTATRRNARLNAADSKLWIGLPDELPTVEADLILANIVARPLIEHASFFAHSLRPSGQIVLSGLIEAQAPEVQAAFSKHFETFEATIRDGWVRLAAHRCQ